jgi:5-methylcytosine-specific restriction protein A
MLMLRQRICGCGRKVASGLRCACSASTHASSKAASDARRPTARERGYDTRWDKARVGYLLRHPVCAMCCGRASVVDHKTPHRGDRSLFWDSANWQPLCTSCHSSRKQSIERSGSASAAEARRMPTDLRPSAIPVVVVCGPPGAGKTTFVRRSAGPQDLIIDLDDIKQRLSRLPRYAAGPSWTAPALEERNRMLRSLATNQVHERAWFIVGAPTKAERDQWQQLLGAERVELVLATFATCAVNLRSDPQRAAASDRFIALAAAWWKAFEADRNSQPLTEGGTANADAA